MAAGLRVSDLEGAEHIQFLYLSHAITSKAWRREAR
jgi:hypothetical protein